MKIDTRDMVNVSEASRKGVSWLVSKAEEGHPVLIVKNSEPSVVVTNVETMERLSTMDETIENLQLLTAALVRRAADNGDRFDLDDVIAELDIDEDGDN
jgi:prevent-host-death family protein